jgi:hypothetical protein
MFYIGRGDLEPDMRLDVVVNGVEENLSDATDVKLMWVKPGADPATPTEVTLDEIDAAVGAFKRTWEAGDTDLPGIHRAKLRCLRGNGEQQTFPPDDSWIRWVVGGAS